MDSPLPPLTEPVPATLTLPDGRSFSIPILRGRGLGSSELFLDASGLSGSGFLVYDPGFSFTAACASAVTFIDGPGGRCLYRGIRVDELARKSSYPAVAYLLLHGRLPSVVELADWEALLKRHALVHEKFKEFFGGFQLGAHPMAIMVAVVGAMSAFEGGAKTASYPPKELAAKVIAKFPTLAAMAYKTAIGEPIVYPLKRLSFAANFLRMMFARPDAEYEPLALHVKALEAFLILHADHEQNASTATVRIAGSSQANPFACLAAGIASLWGPAHGGANEAVMAMLDEIASNPENSRASSGRVSARSATLTADPMEDDAKIAEFLTRVKNKEVRLMGFGHRVYKNFDPRAVFMRELTLEVLEKSGNSGEFDPLLRLAMKLESAALQDEYFVKRKLYPNVDFYSGILLKAIGIPISMYTVLFAMARSAGWVTHWLEMSSEPTKIGRPRQIFVGGDEMGFSS